MHGNWESSIPPFYRRLEPIASESAIARFNEGLHWDWQARFTMLADSHPVLTRTSVIEVLAAPISESELAPFVEEEQDQYFSYYDITPRRRN